MSNVQAWSSSQSLKDDFLLSSPIVLNIDSIFARGTLGPDYTLFIIYPEVISRGKQVDNWLKMWGVAFLEGEDYACFLMNQQI